MKKIVKTLLCFLFVTILCSCEFINFKATSSSTSYSKESTSSLSSSSYSSITSNSSSSSISTNSKTYGTVPNNLTVLSSDEAIKYMQSSSWSEGDTLCVNGIINSVRYNSTHNSYTIEFLDGFQIYSGKLADGLTVTPEIGDIITASGKSTIYKGNTYEIAYSSSHRESPVIHQIIKEEKQEIEVPDEFEDYGFDVITIDANLYSIEKDGLYNQMAEVALYIHIYETLPSNYRKKSQFNKSDYTSSNKLSTGGDQFYNKEGLLPKKSGRTFIEADIDYRGGSRNSKRIVYSSDFLIFYTNDHYASFSIIRII